MKKQKPLFGDTFRKKKKYKTLFGSPLKLKKKTRPLDKNVRSVVWQKYNPNSISGTCYACGRLITNDNFELGHNKSVFKHGKDTIQNLRPICKPCNSCMGTMSIERYKAKYFGKKGNK